MDFRTFYETAPVAFLVLAPDRPRFTILAASDAYLRVTRTSRDIIGRGIFEVFPDDPDDPASTGSPARASFERVIGTRRPDAMAVQKHSIRRPCSEGGGFEERYWSPINTPVLGEDGEVLYIHHRVEDVTEFVRQTQHGAEQQALADTLRTRAGEMEADVLRRARELQDLNAQLRIANERLEELNRERERRAEERVREGTALLQAISDTSPDVMFAKDRDGRIRYANPATLVLIGKPLEQVIGKTDAEFLDDAEAARQVMENDRRIMDGGVAEEVEEHVPLPDGTGRVWLSRKVPYRDGAGNVVALLGVSRDITERRRALDALRESEERLRAAHERLRVQVESSPLAVIEWDADYRVVGYSGRAQEMFGWTPAEVIGRRIDEIPWVPEEDWPAVRVVMRDLSSGARPTNVNANRNVRKDGQVISCEWYNSTLRDDRGRLVSVLSLVLDVTERERAEQALRDSEAKFRSVLENMSEGLMLFDGEVNLEYQNPASLRIHGFDPRGDGRIGHTSVPTTWEAWDEQGRPVLFDEWPVSRVFRGERFQDQILRVRRVETGQEFHGSYNGSPIRDATGKIVLGFITIREITQQVQAEQERRRVEAALREANAHLREEHRRKDEFLGMLSHELRNPLAPIRNSIYLLFHAEPGSEQVRRAQGVIERQTEHLTRLVDDLLDVTRISRGKIELRRSQVDLREVVHRAAEDLRLTMDGRGIVFRTALPDQRVSADVDATRITQIVGNLLHNAAKFTRRGDEVVLTLTADREQAVILVRDSGAGIDPALLPTIFDPFVQGERTLARTEGGLGLGLALVKGIAELHGGSVRVESAGRGKGAQFIVRIPLTEAPVHSAPQAAETQPRKGGRRVLVVDDNADAADSLADLVRMLGHEVAIAHDGASALEAALASRPHCVLCDIGLPGMDGYAVARAVRAAGLDSVQLIAVSGYAQPDDVQKAIEAGFDDHIAKPPDPAKIERLLA